MAAKPLSSPTIDYAADTSWGPETLGATLVINPTAAYFQEVTKRDWRDKTPMVVDVEDDEKGTFVGIGLAYDDKHVFYFTEINTLLRDVISREVLIGHNIKSDLHKMRKWGMCVTPYHIHGDTMIQSYVQNSTRESQGLKELAKELLNLTWPSYRDIVGKGAKKKTLDQQDVTLVARYNGMDVLATYRLYQYFQKVLTPEQQHYYDTLELPLTRLLYEVEEKGVMVDIPYLEKLDSFFAGEIGKLEASLKRLVSAEHRDTINFNSHKQVKDIFLQENGIKVSATNKEALRPYTNTPLIQMFQRYRELKKLRSTYSSALLNLPTAPIVHTSYNQCSYSEAEDNWGGIRTGRLSSSDPNLQNIPTRTALGDTLRRAFIPRPGYVYKDFDYSQIEWRLAAHLSGDKAMIAALLSGQDPYQMVADRAKKSRSDTKTAMLAMNYNAGGYKVAAILNVPNHDGFAFVEAYQDTFPEYFGWKDAQLLLCRERGYITTLFNRTIRPEGEFLAVPYMIQGSAGEIIKTAMLRCQAQGFLPAITVHDELLFELEENGPIAEQTATITGIMESIVDLKVPLKVDVGHGYSWQEAKG